MSIGTTAGITAAIIGGTAAAGSAAIGAHAIGSAASKQESAAQQSIDLQRQQFEQQQQNEAPWLAAGGAALGKLGSMADFTAPTEAEAAASPGYQFALNQGLQGVSRNAAATGMTGGAAAKLSDRYATGLANSTYNDVYNRALQTYGTNRGTLLSLAGLGQTATGQINSAGANYADQSGNILQNSANAQGAAGLAQGNILGSLGLQLGQLGSGALNQLYKPANASSYAPETASNWYSDPNSAG